MTEPLTIEELLAAWRDAQRVLDEADPLAPGRPDLEARVHELRLLYQARVDEIGHTAQPPVDGPARPER